MPTTALVPDPALLATPIVRQHWERYTAEEHDVWATLYRRRVAALATTGSERVLAGIERIGLRPEAVPDLMEVNVRLAPRTGWRAVATGGFLPAREFFASLARREFPTTITVRPRAQLEYLPEPDIFHDVFGHVPLHADPVFASLLQRIGALSLAASGDAQTAALARLFWFTIEFGLVREDGRIRIYGSGLVSSSGDAANALGPKVARRPFVLEDVLQQEFRIDQFQDTLFVIESFEQLAAAIEDASQLLELQ
jgi:phenylalanine-4-hydroxylase